MDNTISPEDFDAEAEGIRQKILEYSQGELLPQLSEEADAVPNTEKVLEEFRETLQRFEAESQTAACRDLVKQEINALQQGDYEGYLSLFQRERNIILRRILVLKKSLVNG